MAAVPLLRIAGVEEESIVDGPGIRMTVFTQGCLHHCPGCHNPQTHALDGGMLVRVEEIFALFQENPLLAGITFSGGEPFLQPKPLVWLADRVRECGKNVLAFSGYTYEQLLEKGERDSDVLDLLERLDWLVDGPYIEAERDLELLFRGSSNQRFLSKAEMCVLKEKWQRSIVTAF